MEQLELGNVTERDKDQLFSLFSSSITSAFEKEGITDRVELVGEINKQMSVYLSSLESPNVKFYIARDSAAKIVGTIAYGPVNDDIKQFVRNLPSNAVEVKCVYVDPRAQGKGVGSFLWNNIISELNNDGYKTAYLDSGYSQAQTFWSKRIGNPSIDIKNKWGEGTNYMIWVFEVERFI